MRRHICGILLLAVLLTGCSGGSGGAPEDPSESPGAAPAADQSAAPALPDPPFIDDPASPYPMVVREWEMDMDGDGTPELVQLQAEKGYFGNEEDSWYEAPEMGLNPYLLTVTKGTSQYLCPLGWELGDEQPLRPCYFSMAPSSPCGGAFWTQDQSGRPALVLWSDNMSQGGAGGIDVYAFTLQEEGVVPLPVEPYSIAATLNEDCLIAQAIVPETGYTQELDYRQWLEACRERNPNASIEPSYGEDGALLWPGAPGRIDGFCHVEQGKTGITLRQYVWATAHVDGVGELVTSLSWEAGRPVVVDQYFDWGYNI